MEPLPHAQGSDIRVISLPPGIAGPVQRFSALCPANGKDLANMRLRRKRFEFRRSSRWDQGRAVTNTHNRDILDNQNRLPVRSMRKPFGAAHLRCYCHGGSLHLQSNPSFRFNKIIYHPGLEIKGNWREVVLHDEGHSWAEGRQTVTVPTPRGSKSWRPAKRPYLRRNGGYSR